MRWKSKFKTNLAVNMKSDSIWILDEPLIYHSDKLGSDIIIPRGFETDFASVPRVPVIYSLWGDRVHREPVLHDYLYRTDSVPVVPRKIADYLFREALIATGKPFYISHCMWAGVRIGGGSSYHRRSVRDHLA